MNKTKIVATLGPSSSSKEVLREMFIAGLNVCRVNFSHGSYEQHASVIMTVRELNIELNANVAVLADLQGPKIRTGLMENDGVHLEVGAACQIVTEPITGNANKFSINYKDLPKDVNPGERILLDDGKLVLQIEKTDRKNCIDCTVVQGGILSSKKGVNFPNTKISMPSL
ncbi:MAG: pyruvate kinase, partial [Flavobacteriia bacterium]|nr:pyruvate kinase [Flavobacteriia bacterium]